MEHESKEIPLNQLLYDPENPRLPTALRGAERDEVVDWMLRTENIVELMGSIGQVGYFPGEPLMVVPTADDPEKYYVVEGNRRFTAVLLLREPSLARVRRSTVQETSDSAEYRPEKLPALVFGSKAELLTFLGYRHVTGIKPWDSLAKARYLKLLQDSNPTFKHADLARLIGSRADYVARLLSGFAIYEEVAENAFFGIKGLNEETISFSVLTTALNYANIARFLGLQTGRDPNLEGLDRRNLAELTHWLFDTTAGGSARVPESRSLRSLNEIVASERALSAFRAGATLQDALILTGERTQAYRTAVSHARERLEFAQNQVHLVSGLGEVDLEQIREIQSIAKGIRVLVIARLTEDDEDEE